MVAGRFNLQGNLRWNIREWGRKELNFNTRPCPFNISVRVKSGRFSTAVVVVLTAHMIQRYFRTSCRLHESGCASVLPAFILKFCPHVSCVAFSSCPFSVFTCLLFVYIVCVLPHVFISSSCVIHLFVLQWLAVSPRDVLCFLFLALFLEFFLTWSMLFVAL